MSGPQRRSDPRFLGCRKVQGRTCPASTSMFLIEKERYYAKTPLPHCLQPLENGYQRRVRPLRALAGNRNPEGALPLGTQLGGRYTVGTYLSADGDGLAYRGVLNDEKKFVSSRNISRSRSATGAARQGR